MVTVVSNTSSKLFTICVKDVIIGHSAVLNAL